MSFKPHFSTWTQTLLSLSIRLILRFRTRFVICYLVVQPCIEVYANSLINSSSFSYFMLGLKLGFRLFKTLVCCSTWSVGSLISYKPVKTYFYFFSVSWEKICPPSSSSISFRSRTRTLWQGPVGNIVTMPRFTCQILWSRSSHLSWDRGFRFSHQTRTAQPDLLYTFKSSIMKNIVHYFNLIRDQRSLILICSGLL